MHGGLWKCDDRCKLDDTGTDETHPSRVSVAVPRRVIETGGEEVRRSTDALVPCRRGASSSWPSKFLNYHVPGRAQVDGIASYYFREEVSVVSLGDEVYYALLLRLK